MTPLVTVGVVCYNAEEFILESLNSVYYQTYSNIELIVSDDNSTDDTVRIVNEWFQSHKERFVRFKVLTVEKNTGTSGNGNRAIQEARGEWYKSLDGDDILAETAIADYVDFVKQHENVHYVFGRTANFLGSYSKEKLNYHEPAFYPKLYSEETTAKEQFDVLIKHFAASGTSGFYRLNTLKKLGCYDERFPLMEDHPLLIKMTKNGYKLWLLDKITLYYRISPKSITNSKNSIEPYLSNSDVRQVVEYKYEYFYENYNLFWKCCLLYTMTLKKLIIKFGNSKNIFLCVVLYNILRITNPYSWNYKYLLTFKYKR